ncbi:MAG: DUF1295 domain-containing protein [Dehalococcoidales bacterium]|nr:DUF1295 domain-containing protein [Dehalococcoidales bacterium]
MSQGKIEDLIEMYQKGELTSKEAYEELKKQGLVEHERWEFIPWVIYFLLLLLPSWAEALKLDFLQWFAELPRFYLPTTIIYTSIALVAIGTLFIIWGCVSHHKRGGLRMAGETLIFYREGLFRVMRHPTVAGVMIWATLLPIILSQIVSFTYLSIGAIAINIVRIPWGIRAEEKLSIAKWGDEYRQYMKEVPRFNFILGLWRLRGKPH